MRQGKDAKAGKVTLDTPMTELDRAAINAMRKSYGEIGLTEDAVERDPIRQFQPYLPE